MAARVAWVLNLDADLELGAASSYEPRRSVRVAMGPHVARLAAALLDPGDLLLGDPPSPGVARGLVGRAFCPTPRALAQLRRAGAEPERSPPVEVLRRVNSRAFASGLGATLPGAAFVTTLAEAEDVLASEPWEGGAWRLKHAFGMAGRNQRVAASPRPDSADRQFLRAGLAHGGVQIEPNVAVVAEYAMHGMLAPDGSLAVGRLVRQRCDARGAWLATESLESGATEVHGFVRDGIEAEVRGVGRALSEAGYFGPYGVDAYCYRSRSGELRLQPRSEINARYSMGFSTGFPRAP